MVGIEEMEEEEGEGGEEEEEGGRDEGPDAEPIQKDETEEGFSVLAQRLVNSREGKLSGTGPNCGESSDMDISEDEVEVH